MNSFMAEVRSWPRTSRRRANKARAALCFRILPRLDQKLKRGEGLTLDEQMTLMAAARKSLPR